MSRNALLAVTAGLLVAAGAPTSVTEQSHGALVAPVGPEIRHLKTSRGHHTAALERIDTAATAAKVRKLDVPHSRYGSLWASATRLLNAGYQL